MDNFLVSVLPGYIGSIAGFDESSGKVYAYDKNMNAMIASSDGVQWGLVDSIVQASLDMTALGATVKVIPGYDQTSLSPIPIGTWEGTVS